MPIRKPEKIADTIEWFAKIKGTPDMLDTVPKSQRTQLEDLRQRCQLLLLNTTESDDN